MYQIPISTQNVPGVKQFFRYSNFAIFIRAGFHRLEKMLIVSTLAMLPMMNYILLATEDTTIEMYIAKNISKDIQMF